MPHGAQILFQPHSDIHMHRAIIEVDSIHLDIAMIKRAQRNQISIQNN